MMQRPKQCLYTVEETQQYKRFQLDFFGTISKVMLKNLLGNVTNVRRREKVNKVLSELHSVPFKTDTMQHIGIIICILTEANGFKHLTVFIEYFSKW